MSGRLALIGVDTLKASLFDRIARQSGVRFSATLKPHWYEQLASERKVVRYHRGQPVRSFERIKGKRAEALDCVIYAMAARHGLTGIDWAARAKAVTSRIAVRADAAAVAAPRAGVIRSHWMGQFR